MSSTKFFSLLDLPSVHAAATRAATSAAKEQPLSGWSQMLPFPIPNELARLTADRINVHLLSAVIELLFTLFAPIINVISAIMITYRVNTHGQSKNRKRKSNKWVVFLICFALTKTVFFHFSYRPTYETPHGFFFNKESKIANIIVSNWEARTREYKPPIWLTNGDTQTLIPFIFNKHEKVDYERRWVPVEDGIKVALDCSMPTTGHDFDKPVFLILHGLNGGSQEEYVKDSVLARNREGSTACVMIARGLMQTPVENLEFFHGARLSDLHHTAIALRKTLAEGQLLIGSGFSMGAIIMNNYFASYGEDNMFDAAVTFGGGLDVRHQVKYYRSMRLWQPFLADELRNNFITPHEEAFRQRVSAESIEAAKQCRDITQFDNNTIIPYHGFADIDDYYSQMGAAGDWDGDKKSSEKLKSIARPIAIIHALNDPIVHELTMTSPPSVVADNPNIIFLITEQGGHVSWPCGNVFEEKWMWMSNVMGAYSRAFEKAIKTV